MVVVVFGCDRSLKGVVGRGWVRCLGHWSWLGCGSGVWVVGDGVGQWRLWVVDRRGYGLWVVDRCGWVVDRRLKGVVGRGSASWHEWVVGRGSATEVGRWSWLGRGRGWVVVRLWLRWLR